MQTPSPLLQPVPLVTTSLPNKTCCHSGVSPHPQLSNTAASSRGFSFWKNACNSSLLKTREKKKMLSFFERSELTSYGITENVKKLLPSQDDSEAPVLPWAETFLCSRIQRLIVKSCSVLQSTFCIRLRYKSGRSTAQHEMSVRVLGRGLSTPTTYRSSSSLPGSWQKRFNPKKTAS